MSARLPRVNVLLVGPDDAVDDMVTFVKAERSSHSGGGGPVSVWRPGKPFELPDPASAGLMILRDVDTLVQADQYTLLEWLVGAAGRVQVVSTASSSLMPLVDTGVFVQALYYRLNTIYVDLTERRGTPGEW